MAEKKHVGHNVADDDDHHPPLPGTKPHHCTDIFCLVLFVVALGGVCYLIDYAFEFGDMMRITRGFDYEGNLCGVDTPGDFIMWCEIPLGHGAMDVTHPICVDECPTDRTSMIDCYDPMKVSRTPRASYPTRHYGSKACIPLNISTVKELFDKTSNDLPAKIMKQAQALSNCWRLLAGIGIFAIFAGYLYLGFLHCCASCLVRICGFIMVMLPMCAGIYFLYISEVWKGASDTLDENLPEPDQSLPGLGNDTYELIVGLILVAVGLLCMLILFCAHKSLEMAIGCVEAACECMKAEPTLLLEPIVALVLKGFWFTLMTAGFVFLCTIGNVEYTGSYGIQRTFTYTDEQWYYLYYYIFMMFWVLEMCTSLSQFVQAYAVQLWYFTPYVGDTKKGVPSWGILRGYACAIRYHLGTLAFGAFLIAIFRFIRMCLSYIAKQSEASGNVVAEAIAKCLICVVTCFQRFLEFINKNAYMDVAICSSNFCTAARRALGVIMGQVVAMALLNNATFMIQMVGFGVITTKGAALTYWAVTHFERWRLTTSPYYVEDPITFAIIGGIISFLIAYPFILVFDTVSDTILYCCAVENKRGYNADAATHAKANDDREAQKSGGLADNMFGLHEEMTVLLPDNNQVYAPPRLRRLLDDHA